MKKSIYLLWPAAIAAALSLTASCGGGDDDSDGDGKSGDGDGDGDGDTDEDSTGDGDGDGDGDAGGNGGESGSGCGAACTDDGDPCTEDVCNEETGTCGLPRTGNACDDGIYCNGTDTCDAGECSTHVGDPCPDTSCNEGKKACECSSVSHCPGADLSADEFGGPDQWGTIGTWGECMYDNVCDEACSCSAAKTIYACTAGSCVGTPSVVNDSTCDSRDTENVVCTANANFCDGAEKCVNAICTSPGDPCEAEPVLDICDEGGNQCDECAVDDDCDGTDHCCRGECLLDTETCVIIIPKLLNNLVVPIANNPFVIQFN